MHKHQRLRRLSFFALALLALVGCGGGGSSNPSTRLVAEVFSKTSELNSAELQSNAGAAGDNAVSRAIKDSGKQHLMGLLFMFEPSPVVDFTTSDVIAMSALKVRVPRSNTRLLGPPQHAVNSAVAPPTSNPAGQDYLYFNSGLGDDPVVTDSNASNILIGGQGGTVLSTDTVTFVKSYQLASDAEQRLLRYIQDNRDLLEPGVRVLVYDEVFWNPDFQSDAIDVLQPQLEALRAGIALVRKHLPQVSIGITVTPYASFEKPNTLAFTKQILALVDWVGTDPYWFGAPEDIAPLHDWSRTFHALAKQANPRVETWFIAQAFKFAAWDSATYNRFIAEQLRYAEQYDHIMFFGWQYVSELDPTTAGAYFPPETKRVYASYLKP